MLAVSEHPAVDHLEDWVLGRCPLGEAEAVAEHLAACPACQQRTAAVGGDGFTDLLREADAGEPAPLEELPAALGEHPRYRFLRRRGGGGMGSVWMAEHKELGRTVAVKVIRPEFLADARAVERFRREVLAAGKLHHPHIVTAYDAEVVGGYQILAMEYVEGQSLDEYLAERGQLPVHEACDVARQALLGLQHAHEHGLVHRDVKPHNLMRTTGGQVKLLDFGMARLVHAEAGEKARLTGANVVLGTVDYIAPEQAANAQSADIRADLYSLGCTLYELLAGQPPYPRGSIIERLMAHALHEAPPLRSVRPDVPAELAAVVATLLAKRPAERYASPAEAGQALEPFCQAGAKAYRKPPRHGWAIVAALGAAALALALGVIVRVQTDKGELVIESESGDVEVVVSQDGKEVAVIDTKTQKRLTLPSGSYGLAVPGADGLTLDVEKATLMRGGVVLARVTRLAKPVAHADRGHGEASVAPPKTDPPDVELQRLDERLAMYRESQAVHNVPNVQDGILDIHKGREVLIGKVGRARPMERDGNRIALAIRPDTSDCTLQNVGVSANGRYAFAATNKSRCKLFDAMSGAELCEVPGHQAVFLGDGERVAVFHGSIRIHKTRTGELIQSGAEVYDQVYWPTLDGAGRLMAFRTNLASAIYYDLLAMKELAAITANAGTPPSATSPFAFAPDESLISNSPPSYRDAVAKSWPRDGGAKGKLEGVEPGDFVLVASADATLVRRKSRLLRLDAKSGKLLTDLGGLVPAGELIALGTTEATPAKFNSAETQTSFTEGATVATPAAFNPAGTRAAFIEDGQTVVLVDLVSNKRLDARSLPGLGKARRDPWHTRLNISSEGLTVVTASEDTLYVLRFSFPADVSPADGLSEELDKIEAALRRLRAEGLGEDHPKMRVLVEERKLLTDRLRLQPAKPVAPTPPPPAERINQSGRHVADRLTVPGLKGPIYHAGLSHDARYAFVTSKDLHCQILDTTTGTTLHDLPGYRAAFVGDGERIVVIGDVVRLYETRTGQLLNAGKERYDELSEPTVDPTGQYLIAWTTSEAVAISLTTLDVRQRFDRKPKDATSRIPLEQPLFTGDGLLLLVDNSKRPDDGSLDLTGEAKKTIPPALWDVTQGKIVRELPNLLGVEPNNDPGVRRGDDVIVGLAHDGSTALLRNGDNLRRIDLATGTALADYGTVLPVRQLIRAGKFANAATPLTPDGKAGLFIVDGKPDLELRELATGQVLWRYKAATAVAWWKAIPPMEERPFRRSALPGISADGRHGFVVIGNALHVLHFGETVLAVAAPPGAAQPVTVAGQTLAHRIPLGWGKELHSLALSPDGTRLFAGKKSLHGVMLDAKSGAELWTCSGYAAAFLGDGSTVSVIGDRVRVHETATGKLLREGQDRYTTVGHLEANRVGTHLLIEDRAPPAESTLLIDLANMSVVHQWRGELASGVYRFTADGGHVAFGTNSSLRWSLHRIADGIARPGFNGVKFGDDLLAFPTNSATATVKSLGAVIVRDLATGEVRRQYPAALTEPVLVGVGQREPVEPFASPDGRWLLTAVGRADTSEVRLHRSENGAVAGRLTAEQVGAMFHVERWSGPTPAWSATGRGVAVATVTGDVVVMPLSADPMPMVVTIGPPPMPAAEKATLELVRRVPRPSPEWKVKSLGVAPDGRWMFAAFDGVNSRGEREPSYTASPANEGETTVVAAGVPIGFVDGGESLLVFDGELHTVPLAKGRERRSAGPALKAWRARALSPDGQFIALGANDTNGERCALLDAATLGDLKPLEGSFPKDRARRDNRGIFSADSRWVLTPIPYQTEEPQALMWDTKTGKPVPLPAGLLHYSGRAIALWPDRNLWLKLRSPGEWSYTALDSAEVSRGGRGPIDAVALTADGRFSAAANRETVRLYAYTSAESLAEFRLPVDDGIAELSDTTHHVPRAAISPDGQFVAAVTARSMWLFRVEGLPPLPLLKVGP